MDRLEHLFLSGFTQVDYLRRQISEDQLSDGSGEPLNENRFILRHARVRLDGDWRYAGFSGDDWWRESQLIPHFDAVAEWVEEMVPRGLDAITPDEVSDGLPIQITEIFN